jgi:Cd2+/Zn2+-exporting ATPase
VYRGLVFLVISCPCALVISIPLSFFAGIGACSRKGILVKGANFLEALNRLHTVVWDKTGTLTQGRFAVHDVQAEAGFVPEEVLALAAAAERHSSHPIAQALVREAEDRGQGTEDRSQRSEIGDQLAEIRLQETEDRGLQAKGIDSREDLEVQEFSGQGVRARVGAREVLVGNPDFLRSQGVSMPEGGISDAGVWVGVDKRAAGRIQIQDVLRPQARQAVQGLKGRGVSQFMLTGDSWAVADEIGAILGLDGVEAQLLPQDKVARLEAIMDRTHGRGYTLFVGDGINDAPVLARSDIGVAMGGLGSDAAIEAADILLMKLLQAVSVAERTRTIVWQNITMALGFKALILVMGAAGLASMWAAVFADVGVALLAVGNSLRIMRG